MYRGMRVLWAMWGEVGWGGYVWEGESVGGGYECKSVLFKARKSGMKMSQV